MKLKLYTSSSPSGRCAILIKCLGLATLADAQWCIQAGQRLFDGQYQFDSPLILQVMDITSIDKLLTVCKEFGIIFQIEE